MGMMLLVNDIHTYYGNSYILQGVSLHVQEGAVAALLGRNGMGKTTTIRSIMNLNPPRRGTVQFKGAEITHLKPYQVAKMGIGYVPQGRKIFPSLSVQENLTMPARVQGRHDAWTLGKIYSFFPILEKRARLKGNLLSGGEQQMLTIARALITNPDLLLMDEPSEGLSPRIVQEIGRIITSLKNSGFSILLVEQNLQMALKTADHVFVMSKGTVVFASPAEEFQKNQAIREKYLGVSGQQ
jgi:branched-chain amino acid transport system ATP-binding protein